MALPTTLRLDFDSRVWRLVAAVMAVVAAAAVVRTYGVFSQTWDEPAHLAAGMQWLSEGQYTYEAEHPPLARVAAALGPFLAGERSHGFPAMYDEGRAIIGSGAHYRHVLALARLGELPFFLLLIWIVWAWGLRLTNEAGAAIAVLFTVTNPNLLAHAGLATIDMAPTALTAAALFSYAVWLDRPGWRESAWMGLAFGLAAVSKFSAIGFVGVALAVAHPLRRAVTGRWWVDRTDGGPRPAVAALSAAGIAALTVWAMYRFHVGVIPETSVVAPAPMFLRGLYDFAHHGGTGHPAFLLGEVRSTGWWYYFPIVLLVKTPVPLLLFAVAGTVLALRAPRQWPWMLPLALSVAVVALSMTSKVDLGVRLVLAIYPAMALLAARGAIAVWEDARGSRLARVVAPAAFAYAAIVPVAAYPDYIAYFNPLAGPHPERVLVDSNLDWGQDLYRLAAAERSWHMDSLYVHYFGSSSLSAAGVTNARRLAPNERPTGWVAASETFLAGVWSDTSLAWLNRLTPVERVGHSMQLYFIEPPRRPAGADTASASPSRGRAP